MNRYEYQQRLKKIREMEAFDPLEAQRMREELEVEAAYSSNRNPNDRELDDWMHDPYDS